MYHLLNFVCPGIEIMIFHINIINALLVGSASMFLIGCQVETIQENGNTDSIKTVIGLDGSDQGDAVTVGNVRPKIRRITSVSTTQYHTLRVLGIPMRVVGRGARLLRGPGEGQDISYVTSSINIGGGEAIDVILDTEGVAPGTYFLYDTQYNFLSNFTEDYGGMMTEIRITEPFVQPESADAI